MNRMLMARPMNSARPLKATGFRVLMLCDGKTELSRELLSEEEWGTLEFFVEKGIVQPSKQPNAIQSGQEYRYYDNRFVKSAIWSLTGRCNYRCRHCYMDAPEGALGELSHEEAMDIIEQLADCGVLRVDLTGGEPFVRADFWELIDSMLSHGIAISQIYTNGWLVDEKLLRQLEQRGIKPSFSLSFDGVGWHDWMRGIKGAEEAALRALRLCIDHGFQVNVEMCIHKGNAHTLRETVNLLSSIGVPDMKCGIVSDTEPWMKNNEGNTYSFREYSEDMLSYIPNFFEDGCPMNLMLGSIITLYKNSTKFNVIPEHNTGTNESINCHLCGSARSNCYITPEGRLLPCLPMTACKEQEQFPKIADVGLRKGLSESFFMEFVDRRVKDLMEANQKCRECPYVLKCGGGCRAAALAQTGDLMGVDENLCMLWNEGYVDRIRQTAEDAVRRFCPEKAQDETTA